VEVGILRFGEVTPGAPGEAVEGFDDGGDLVFAGVGEEAVFAV
jgi:hypothetical protein